jgi:pSer/pThr/pTyr-binding forkhead associated (FHA) protein
MQVKLVVVSGKKAGLSIPVATPKFTIGRGAYCHIRPQNGLIGELHCQISVDGDSAVLEDCGSETGTFVNGQRIQQHTLRHQDRIKIGDLEFETRLAAPAPVGNAKPEPPLSKPLPAQKSQKTAGKERLADPNDLLFVLTVIPLAGVLLSFLPKF